MTDTKPRPTAASRTTSIALSFTAGYVDTVGFVAIAGLFTAHVTGNFVVIGAALVASKAGLLGKLLALPTFVVAVACARLVAARYEALDRSPARALIVIQIVLLLTFMALGFLASPITNPDRLLPIAAGLVGVCAMATQNAAAKLAFSDLTPTTVMTGNVTQLVLDAVDLLRGHVHGGARVRLSRMWPPILAFAVGAIGGAYSITGIGFVALALPAVVLCGVFYLQRGP